MLPRMRQDFARSPQSGAYVHHVTGLRLDSAASRGRLRDFTRPVPMTLIRPRLSSLVLALSLFAPLALSAAEIAPSAPSDTRELPGTAPRTAEPEIDPATEEPMLAISRMRLPPGLVAKLWAAEPMLANPVAFTLDEKGRVFVSETHRYRTSVIDIRDIMWMLEDELANRNQADFLATLRKHYGEKGLAELSKESEIVRLLEDTDGDGRADKSSIYADDFRTPLDGIASGVLARRGEVWFTNIPSLWKFTGKDKAETRTEVHRGFGVRFNYTGHDFHGLALGPDGRLYFSIGDRGAAVTNQEGRLLDVPDTGSVMRMWPDGSGLEVFAVGLRNPQELVFNEYGDLFTGDNDSDQGEEERLVHVVEGADHGWRIGYQFAPRGRGGPWNEEALWAPRRHGQPAYIVPGVCSIEDGPSGLTYYPGTGLTPEFSGRIFLTHFKGAISNSGIFTYKLRPDGASYAVEDADPFLTGALPTDVEFGPDGRLYYSDWAEGWPKSRRGRIYAIADPAHENDPLTKSTQALIASDFTGKSADELAQLLGHPDWRVRLEAQYELAGRGTASVPTALAVLGRVDERPLARRHALWALGQIARRHRAVGGHILKHTADGDAEIRAQAASLAGEVGTTSAPDLLVPLLRDPSARVRFFAALSLAKLKHAAATPALLEAARTNDDADAHLRHALVMGLAGCATPAQLAATARDSSSAVRLAAILALRRQGATEITAFLRDPDPLLVREAALAIADAPIEDAFPALAEFIAAPVADEATMFRALNAGFRLGTTAQARAIGAFAARPEVSDALRKEAVTHLTQWAEPPARDRNVGIYRPLSLTARDTQGGREMLEGQITALLAAGVDDGVQEAAIAAAQTLKLTSALPSLHRVLADASRDTELRTAALQAIDELQDPQLPAAVEVALASESAELRLAALPISTRLNPSAAPAVLARLAASPRATERRAAYEALGKLEGQEADEILLAGLREFSAGQVPAGAQLELIEAAALRKDERVKQALADYEARLAADPDPLAPFRVSLEGGRYNAGNRIFYNNPVLQCIRCHRVGDGGGGDAGPMLAGIGARDSRELILEHILKPSARIAQGFQIVTLTKKDGSLVSGTLVDEAGDTVRLRVTETEEITVPKSQIAKTESSPSGMPEVAALVLTKSEIRDLVEYVASLKEPIVPREKQPMRALRGLTE